MPVNNTAQWDPAVLFGMAAVAAAVAAILAAAIWGWLAAGNSLQAVQWPRARADGKPVPQYQQQQRARAERIRRGYRRQVIAGAAAALLTTAAGAAWILAPFSIAYLKFEPVNGTLTSNPASRFIAGDSGRGSTQKFAIQIRSGVYGCNDTRCSVLRQCWRVELKCVRTWQLVGVSGEDCNWVGAQSPAGQVIP